MIGEAPRYEGDRVFPKSMHAANNDNLTTTTDKVNPLSFATWCLTRRQR